MDSTQVPPESNVLDRISDGVLVLDREWRISFVNSSGAALVGRTVTSLTGQVFWNEFPDTIGKVFEQQYRGAMASQEPGDFDAFSSQLQIWYAVRTYPTPESLTIVFQDATQRHAADNSIRSLLDQVQRQRRLATVLAETNEMIFRAQSTQELFESATSIAVQHGGFVMSWIGLLDGETGELRREAWAGDGGEEYLRDVTISASDDIYGHGITGQAIRSGLDLFTNDFDAEPNMAPWRKEAARLGVRSSGALPLWVNGEVRGILSVYAREPSYFNEDERILVHRLAANVAYGWESLQREEDLRESEIARRTAQRFRAVLSAAPDAIIGLNEDGHIEMVNNRATELFGHSHHEIIGQPIEFLITSDNSPEKSSDWIARSRWSEPHHISSELTAIRRDGSRFPVEVTLSSVIDELGQPMTIAAVRDLTERLELEFRRQQFALETQREKQDRLDSLGRLASGVAHDFNNLLGVILNFITLIEKQEIADQTRSDVSQVRAAAERGAELLRQLLTFARRDASQGELVELGPALRSVTELLARTLGKSIALQLEVSPEAMWAPIDHHQLDQVVVNLALNARDAMPSGGRLWISLTTRPDETLPIWLSVRDSGEGIPHEIIPQIFEPFFTTKPRGQGTGLGLATVYGIVTRVGGRIEVHSEPNNGTTFDVFLPIGKPSGSIEQPPEPRATESIRRGGRVLLVEDNLELRDSTRRILRNSGFDVRVASDGREALEILAALDFAAEVVISDIVMPVLTGLELCERLAVLAPRLPVILMTGDNVVSNSVERTILHKPVGDLALIHAIEEALRDR